jgi:hypothetical protein
MDKETNPQHDVQRLHSVVTGGPSANRALSGEEDDERCLEPVSCPDDDEKERAAGSGGVGSIVGGEMMTLLARPSVIVKSNQILELTSVDEEVTAGAPPDAKNLVGRQPQSKERDDNDDDDDGDLKDTTKILIGDETETKTRLPLIIQKSNTPRNSELEPVVDDTYVEEGRGWDSEMRNQLARSSIVAKSNQILELTDSHEGQEKVFGDSDSRILQEKKELADCAMLIQSSLGKCSCACRNDKKDLPITMPIACLFVLFSLSAFSDR